MKLATLVDYLAIAILIIIGNTILVGVVAALVAAGPGVWFITGTITLCFICIWWLNRGG
jgi:hypothetical protein